MEVFVDPFLDAGFKSIFGQEKSKPSEDKAHDKRFPKIYVCNPPYTSNSLSRVKVEAICNANIEVFIETLL